MNPIKYLPMNQIVELDNPPGVDMSLYKLKLESSKVDQYLSVSGT